MFHLAEIFVATHRICSREPAARFAGADDIDPVECGLALNVLWAPRIAKRPVLDGQLKVLAHLEAIDHRAHFLADLGRTQRLVGAPTYLAGDTRGCVNRIPPFLRGYVP